MEPRAPSGVPASTGIPAAGNTHEIAQEVAPESRVVYVDYDPVVLAHARALLTSHAAGATEYIDADLRDTGTILDRARQVLDFTKPVAITLLAILHAVPEADDPYAVVKTLLDAVPSGSYLALSHLAADRLTSETMGALSDVAERMVRQQITYRNREQIARFFEGTDLVEPESSRLRNGCQLPDRPHLAIRPYGAPWGERSHGPEANAARHANPRCRGMPRSSPPGLPAGCTLTAQTVGCPRRKVLGGQVNEPAAEWTQG